MVTFNSISAASQRIAHFVHRTPVATSTSLNALAGAQLYFKCENLQKVGAFKARGASNALLNAPPDSLRHGVATHSSGNHAQALAYAAQRLGVKCTVVMPDVSPEIKVRATQDYGGHVVFCENTLAAREAALSKVVAQTGAMVVHPYDNDDVIAGQGTAALELLSQVEGLDVIIAPIGGGGLMSGTAIVTHAMHPQMRVYGAEPALAADALKSLETGILQQPFPPVTIADGLRTALCERTFGYLKSHHVNVITASEEHIELSYRLLAQRLKMVVEPSGAVPFAALLENPGTVAGMRVGVILSGGNTSLF